jgi:hypothetical protein
MSPTHPWASTVLGNVGHPPVDELSKENCHG